MFIESFEGNDIINARDKRKQFVENLKKDVDPKKQRIVNMLNDTETIKKDWEKIERDFPII